MEEILIELNLLLMDPMNVETSRLEHGVVLASLILISTRVYVRINRRKKSLKIDESK